MTQKYDHLKQKRTRAGKNLLMHTTFKRPTLVEAIAAIKIETHRSAIKFAHVINMLIGGYGEEDRCLHVALPVVAFLEMLTKSVILRATAATRTGCARHGVGHHTPFSGRGSRNAAKGLRPNILQLNTEGLTEDKISVIEQLAQGRRQRGGGSGDGPPFI